MDYYAYTNPSYDDDDDDDPDPHDCDFYPITRYTFLESITEETADELLGEESQTSWDETSDDEAVTVIHNEPRAKNESIYPVPIAHEETNKDQQLDEWLERSISLGDGRCARMPAFDLGLSACLDAMSPLDLTKRSSSLEDFLIKEFEANNDVLCDFSNDRVECFNGFVRCCHARSLSDLTQFNAKDNLSEDSGYCENEKKGFAIEVILEEETDRSAPQTSYAANEEINLLWERSLESGRAATDDWLGLKINSDKKMGKKSVSLRSLANSDLEIDIPCLDAPVSKVSKAETRDREGSRITSARSDSRRAEGLVRKYAGNWDETDETDETAHLAVSQPLVGEERSRLVESSFLVVGKGGSAETGESMENFVRACPIPTGVDAGVGQTPAKFQKWAGLAPLQNRDAEKVHVVIVNGKEGNERMAWLRVKDSTDFNDMKTSSAITVLPLSNVQYTACHQVQRVNLDDDTNDTATRALEDSYHHMERAINYLQQDINDRHAFYLHQPPINPSRNHIWNARQQYFDTGSDVQSKPPQPDISHVFDDFRKRAKEGRERAARSVLDLQAIDSSVRREIKEMTSSTPAATPTPTSSKPRGAFLHASKRRSRSAGYLETDIDSLLSRQVVDETPSNTGKSDFSGGEQISCNYNAPTKALSMLSLRQQREEREKDNAERARSMEYLLDADNKVAAQPPENQLMHGDEKTLSEHELRVRRSLRQLNVPEWFKNSPYTQAKGFLLKKRDDDNAKKWQGLSSRTPSAPSMGCQSDASMPSNANAMIRINTPHCWRYPGRWSKESLHSSRSPSPMYDKGQEVTRLESILTSQSPTGAIPQASPTMLTKQPYLGWRSSERLTWEESKDSTAESPLLNRQSNFYRSAAERLSAGPGYYALRYGSYPTKPSNEECLAGRTAVSSSLSPTKTKSTIKPPVPPKPYSTPTVLHQNGSNKNAVYGHSSLKKQGNPKSSSRKVVWMESSFVGIKPVTNNGKQIQDNKNEVDLSQGQRQYDGENRSGPRFSLTGLEEVLNLLLAIPTSSHSVSSSSSSVCSDKIKVASKNDISF